MKATDRNAHVDRTVDHLGRAMMALAKTIEELHGVLRDVDEEVTRTTDLLWCVLDLLAQIRQDRPEMHASEDLEP
jgi:hypothetical protein